MRFIDLFAGLGGFHLALSRLGHECVFASELDDRLRELYEKNFGIRPAGDIRTVQIGTIPAHQLLCAGFPCQPFSKAGSQHGKNCPKWGDLFGYVLKILRHRKPRFLLLENVPNLSKHNDGDTWNSMRTALRRAGYDVSEQRLSPHQFGIPQVRDRIYIAGSRAGLNGFAWPTATRTPTSIVTALDDQPDEARPLSRQVTECLRVWQAFIRSFPKKKELPSFPIWSMEFGATYPYAQQTPNALGTRALCAYHGAHGVPLNSVPPSERMLALPSYARTRQRRFPDWKIQFIAQNRALYDENKHWIDKWLPRILQFPPSLQKLEWNCKGEIRDIWRYVIQFRASGVRVKRPTPARTSLASPKKTARCPPSTSPSSSIATAPTPTAASGLGNARRAANPTALPATRVGSAATAGAASASTKSKPATSNSTVSNGSRTNPSTTRTTCLNRRSLSRMRSAS